jgi:crotonobetainyl-CoA:carnitine CoA-transferase CaiB-like acyl-CoA transferase
MTEIKEKKKKNVPPRPPLGNQYAKGSTTNGAPRKYDLEEEAKELLKWSLKADSLRLYGFTFNKDYPTQRLEEFAKRSPVFADAIIIAKNRLAMRREQYACLDKTGIPAHVYNKTAHIYDHELIDTQEAIIEKGKEKDLKRKLKEIRHALEVKNELDLKSQVPPNLINVNSDNENMILKAQLANALEIIEELRNKK